MTVRDRAARTQGCADWDDAVRRNNFWLGARIGFLLANVVALPIVILIVIWLVIR